jgi:hypothetical protein
MKHVFPLVTSCSNRIIYFQKPSGSKPAEHGDKSGRPRREDFHGGFNRYGPSDYMYGPLQRQRSFDNYYDGLYTY